MIFISLNFFIGIFNLLPLLPLDGGHIAIAWFERVRSWIYARLKQARPGPGRLLQADAAHVRGDPDRRRVHAADRHRGHRQPDHDLPKVSAPVTAVSLGMPAVPPPPLAPRRQSRQIMVGSVPVGGGAPVVGAVDDHHAHRRRQRHAAADRRADRVRLPDRPGRGAVAGRRRGAAGDRQKSQIPVIADIHFQPKYVFAAIDAGCAAVRVNPGNIRQFDDKVKEIAKAAGGGRACRSGSASTPARWTSGCWRSTARPPPRRWSSRRCGSARCSRSTASATSRSRSSTTTRS